MKSPNYRGKISKRKMIGFHGATLAVSMYAVNESSIINEFI